MTRSQAQALTGAAASDRTIVSSAVEARIDALLAEMTLTEKTGQMSQVSCSHVDDLSGLRQAIREGRIGSVLNEVDVDAGNALQRLAVEESRLGIPLINGRDVIHGFRTIFPIPLGQAASWNPELVERGARIAAVEAASQGVHWTFAPMIDISRDPRWGRIAESLGEEPHLASVLGAAMVRGLQGEDPSAPGSIAACAKHFAGYGAAEAGRDYNTVVLHEQLLRDVYLAPFKAATEAGVLTFMSAFNEINGVPVTGSAHLLSTILRDEWGFEGFVVSDWSAIAELAVHGYVVDDRGAAREAVQAGVDMEMTSTSYADHLADLVREGRVSEAMIDDAVRRILRVKFVLGLFDDPYTDPSAYPALLNADHRAAAKESAVQSVVLLKNEGPVLPLDPAIGQVAVLGPLADAPHEQLGTWVFDGRKEDAVTPLAALRETLGDARVTYVRALATSRSRDTTDFEDAIAAAEAADVALVFVGEEAILSGEAQSRADLDLPGAQNALVEAAAATGTPVVLVVMAGRPLTIGQPLAHADAALYAWHPGTMAGPALRDLLLGETSPSGKLPATIPKMTGQVPIYLAQKNTGRPAPDDPVLIDDIPVEAEQHSVGSTSYHLDAGARPLFPFGYGLSYTTFVYENLALSASAMPPDGAIEVSVDVTNAGDMAADEVVQLYTRDLVGSLTRPVKELKGFQRVRLEPGETRTVTFTLRGEDLAFHTRSGVLATEPGTFHVWVGGDSEADLRAAFEVVGPEPAEIPDVE
ncbi:MAG: beta-glucosidase BglX [Bacteroidetes bacterium]|jgi:beta-glucosidase|nr:beta-glucosidase BglX [Bacteroidota bacterium]